MRISSFLILVFSFVFIFPGLRGESKKAFGSVYLIDAKSGRPVLLDSYLKEGPLVLSFWATYCTACEKEIPEIQALIRKYPEVKLIFINIDPGKNNSDVKRLISKWGMNGTVLLDQYQIAVKHYIPELSVPATFFIKQDRIQYSFLGYDQMNFQEFEKRLAKNQNELDKSLN